ncbi:MAG: MarR family transcriptional regulator [Armatimonadetes bacterium]|nr:MarR family transcriptional regulator [Armatimonadota bacterium]
MDGLNEVKQEAFRSLLTVHARLIERLDRDFAAANVLPLSWYDVLVTLEYEEHGALRMSELAERVLLSRSGLTRLVDRLVEQGYVERKQCPSDRRGQHAVLTPAGQKAREDAWPIYNQKIQEVFGSKITDEEASALTGILQRVIESTGGFRGHGNATCPGRTSEPCR